MSAVTIMFTTRKTMLTIEVILLNIGQDVEALRYQLEHIDTSNFVYHISSYRELTGSNTGGITQILYVKRSESILINSIIKNPKQKR